MHPIEMKMLRKIVTKTKRERIGKKTQKKCMFHLKQNRSGIEDKKEMIT